MYRLVKLLSELTLLHFRTMTLILSLSLLLLSCVPNLLLEVKLTYSLSLHHTLLLISYFRLLSSLASRSLDLGYASYLSLVLQLTYSFPLSFTCLGRGSRNCLDSGIPGLNSTSTSWKQLMVVRHSVIFRRSLTNVCCLD
jgi:hypothetical protein